MPVLAGEFVCPHCGAKLRVQQRGRDSLAIECPECQAPLLVQQGLSGQLEVTPAAQALPALARRPSFWQRQGSLVISAAVVFTVLLGLWGWSQSGTATLQTAGTTPEANDPSAKSAVPGLPATAPSAEGTPAIALQGASSGSVKPAQGPIRPEPADSNKRAEPQASTAIDSPAQPPKGMNSAADSAAGTASAGVFSEVGPDHPFAGKLARWGDRLTDYRTSRGAFPPALWERQSQPMDGSFSWLAGLDPALEKEASLLPQWNLAWDDPLNDRFVRRKRDDLLNPSIPSQASGDRYPASHLVGIAGVGDDAAELPVQHPRAGIFGWNRSTRVEDVKDGLSNTLLATGVNGKVGSWADGSASVRALTMEPYINGPDGLGTGQKQGMYVLMADGSVRFLNQKTSPVIMRRLAAMADGLPLDESVPGEPGSSPRPTAPPSSPEKLAGSPAETQPQTPARGEMGEAPPPETAGTGPQPPQTDPQESVAVTPRVPEKPPLDFDKLLSQPVLVYQLTAAVPLEEVLAEIEALLGAPIQFSPTQLPTGAPQRKQSVRINQKNATIRDLLEDALDETELTYLLEPQRIVILPAPPK